MAWTISSRSGSFKSWVMESWWWSRWAFTVAMIKNVVTTRAIETNLHRAMMQTSSTTLTHTLLKRGTNREERVGRDRPTDNGTMRQRAPEWRLTPFFSFFPFIPFSSSFVSRSSFSFFFWGGGPSTLSDSNVRRSDEMKAQQKQTAVGLVCMWLTVCPIGISTIKPTYTIARVHTETGRAFEFG